MCKCFCEITFNKAPTHRKWPLSHPSAGSLSIFKPLDREEQDVFNLTIIAEDHGIPQRSSSQLLCVHVIDVNDEVPWFEERHYEAHITENQPVGSSVLRVSASDLDQGERIMILTLITTMKTVKIRVEMCVWALSNVMWYVLYNTITSKPSGQNCLSTRAGLVCECVWLCENGDFCRCLISMPDQPKSLVPPVIIWSCHVLSNTPSHNSCSQECTGVCVCVRAHARGACVDIVRSP